MTFSTVTYTPTYTSTVTVPSTTTVFSIYGGAVVSKRLAAVTAAPLAKRELIIPAPQRPTASVQKRQATVVPSSVPSYASACSAPGEFASACSCMGITATVITATTPVTTVTTTTYTTYSSTTKVTVSTSTG